MVSRLAVIVVLTLIYGIASRTPCVAQQEGKEMDPASLQYGLVLLKDRPDDQFTQIVYDKIAPAIRSQVDNYLAFTVTSEAQPTKDARMKAGIFSATERSQNDLVEYRWTFNGVPLRTVQSLNALKLEIPLAGRSHLEDVRALVGSIVKLRGNDIYRDRREYEVHLRWPDTLSDGVQFSSNPGQNIRSMYSWPDRVDAFVESGRLNILIYKKIPQLMTYQDGSRWFEKYPPSKTSSK